MNTRDRAAFVRSCVWHAGCNSRKHGPDAGSSGESKAWKQEERSMNLRRLTPGNGTTAFQIDIDRLIDAAYSAASGHAAFGTGVFPAVDVRETDKEYTLQVDLPGVNPKDVKIELLRDVLTLRGERTKVGESADQAARRSER